MNMKTTTQPCITDSGLKLKVIESVENKFSLKIKYLNKVECWTNILFVKFTSDQNKNYQKFMSYRTIGGKPVDFIKKSKEKKESKYIYVLKSVKGGKTKIIFLSASITEAQQEMDKKKREFNKKGFFSWIKRLSLTSYNVEEDKNELLKLANQFVSKANTLDSMNLGGTFRGDSQVIAAGKQTQLESWANIIRKKVGN